MIGKGFLLRPAGGLQTGCPQADLWRRQLSCPSWPGLERPGRTAATRPSPGPPGPGQGADQPPRPSGAVDRDGVPPTPPPRPVLCPGSWGQHRRPGHSPRHRHGQDGCLDKSSPSHETGVTPQQGVSEDQAVSAQRQRLLCVETFRADCIFSLLVLGEKQPPRQTSRLIKRKTKAKR